MTQKEKAKRYDEALGRARKCLDEKRDTCFVRPDVIFPELTESDDERIRKALIDGFTVMKESKNCGKTFSNHNIPVADILAWLEKQGNKTEEHIFRPIAGCTIDDAARQAIDKATNGENIVFSFNGFYMKIYKDTTIDDIINSYNDFCKKQGKLKWTEEDDDNLNMAIYFIRSENTPYSPTNVEPVVEWLYGLKQRMGEK